MVWLLLIASLTQHFELCLIYYQSSFLLDLLVVISYIYTDTFLSNFVKYYKLDYGRTFSGGYLYLVGNRCRCWVVHS